MKALRSKIKAFLKSLLKRSRPQTDDLNLEKWTALEYSKQSENRVNYRNLIDRR